MIWIIDLETNAKTIKLTEKKKKKNHCDLGEGIDFLDPITKKALLIKEKKRQMARHQNIKPLLFQRHHLKGEDFYNTQYLKNLYI